MHTPEEGCYATDFPPCVLLLLWGRIDIATESGGRVVQIFASNAHLIGIGENELLAFSGRQIFVDEFSLAKFNIQSHRVDVVF